MERTFLIPHAVQRSAEKYPDHPAMRFNKQALTYAELEQQTNRLAHLLVGLGVRRGDRVGVFLNKSLETAVAIYGVMKAGAAYVPLDPMAPAPRLALVLRDCDIRHLITHEPKRAAVAELLAGSERPDFVIGLDRLEGAPAAVEFAPWPALAGLAAEPVVIPGLMGQDLAYIMYTSGSTGAPKGMMHTHFSGLSYARMAADTYEVTHADRLSNHSPLHFDMSTFDFFSGPLCGATTTIIPEPYTKLPASLSKLIEEERLTIWYSVPFALIQLLLHGVMEERDLSSLRWVLFGGEPFPPKHLWALMARLPQARFSNVYGPAEVNQCTYYHVPPLAEDHTESIPIGRVWDNAEGLVIDEADRVVAEGEIGELLIRAPTMMRGYWRRPDLNRRAFYYRQTFDGFDDVFYRTGDLVQALPDGSLRFLGRKDRQIKVRGYRVELDEIENALSRHPAVAENGVYTLPLGDDTLALEAAVLLKHEKQVTIEALKAFLHTQLPGYAVPENLLLVAELPRTGTGKIDRRVLRERALAARSGAPKLEG